MAFWSKFGGALKKIGKGALKVAPIAAAFIPGVGPLAAMGIGAATRAASHKLGGGSWKGALGQGALGAGMGLAGGLGASALKGIGPSSNLLRKIGATARGGIKAMQTMRGMRQPSFGMQNRPFGMTPPFNPYGRSPYGGQQPMGGIWNPYRRPGPLTQPAFQRMPTSRPPTSMYA